MNLISRLRDKVDSLEQRYHEKHQCINEDTGHYNQDLIPGLCPNRCSCSQCRQARIKDDAYMTFVSFRRNLSRMRSTISTSSWNEGSVTAFVYDVKEKERRLNQIYDNLQECFDRLYEETCKKFNL